MSPVYKPNFFLPQAALERDTDLRGEHQLWLLLARSRAMGGRGLGGGMPAAPMATMSFPAAPISPLYSAPPPPIQSQQVSYGVQQVSQTQVMHT